MEIKTSNKFTIKLFNNEENKLYIISAIVDNKERQALIIDDENVFTFSNIFNDELITFDSIEEAERFLEKNFSNIGVGINSVLTDFTIEELTIEIQTKNIKFFENEKLKIMANIISKLSSKEIEFLKEQMNKS